MRVSLTKLLWVLVVVSMGTKAQLAVEEADDYGVLNAVDYSWRYYEEQIDRFPERVGIICYNAYLLDKSGLHKEGEHFLIHCAERGSTSAMIYLALLYEQGVLGGVDLERSVYWIAQAAKLGNPIAQYHYGVALLRGKGVKRNRQQGIAWISKSAKQGEIEAIRYLAATQCSDCQ